MMRWHANSSASLFQDLHVHVPNLLCDLLSQTLMHIAEVMIMLSTWRQSGEKKQEGICETPTTSVIKTRFSRWNSDWYKMSRLEFLLAWLAKCGSTQLLSRKEDWI